MGLTITNVDTGNVILKDALFRDEELTLAGADTIAEGTILARDSVSGKLVIFEKGGTTTGNGIPKALLTYELVVTAGGDFPVRAMQSGEVRKERLIIDADGTGANVDNVVLDQLRDYKIIAQDVNELNILDNQ